ncbi:integral membrane protein Srb [Dictyocaulus viviparus]|uniref:Integral membrane protein Srb n=1 Tax=Dictyocaulus viviparus TaxID=29172 RepID=A0A0D8XML8_DICVI|nr:integral membrane protein Srb [Dictyocaulus viviparus]
MNKSLMLEGTVLAGLQKQCIEYGQMIVTFPYYRCMQIFHIAISVSAVILIFQVFMKYWSKLIFHFNIKILLLSLYAASLLHAISTAVFQTYQLNLSFSYIRPCDVFLPRLFYAFFNLLYSYSNLWIENVQMTMIFERSMAFVFVGHYEKFTKKMGVCLAIFTIVVSAFQCIWTFWNAQFKTPQISYLFSPPESNKNIDVMNNVVFVVHVIGLFAMAFIYIKQRHHQRLGETLSVRFQICENRTSSRLLFALSVMQLTIFLIYPIALFYLKKGYDPHTSSLAVLYSNIHAAYLVPEYTLILPIITMYFLKRAKIKRQSKIQSMIEMRACGDEGWAIHSKHLQKQWE